MSVFPPDGTVLEHVVDRLFRFFAITECSIAERTVNDANSLQVCSQAAVFCLQPEYSGLLMSCQTVDWVCRGVVVSSGPSPSTSLAVSEQGLGFLVSGGGQALQLFVPRLGQAICSFIFWYATVGWDHYRTTVHSWGRSCRSISSWWKVMMVVRGGGIVMKVVV